MTTIKQKRAAKKIVENGGNVSKGMRDAGYSKETAKSPKKLTESRGWEELMKKYISDDDISKAHGELLRASQIDHYVFPKSEKDEVIKKLIESIPGCKLMKVRIAQQWKRAYFWTPDNHSRKDAIDMAYKLKGKYTPQKMKFMDDLENFDDDEIENEINKRNKQDTNRKSN